MNRLTYKDEKGEAATDNVVDAIKRLSQYEDMTQGILRRYDELGALLEELRNSGKKNTVKFRELMGEKLTLTSIMGYLNLYDLI